MLGNLTITYEPIAGFKIYNVAVVSIFIFILSLRTRRLSALWFYPPLLVMADSGVPWLWGLLYHCVLEPRMPTRLALFTSDLVCGILCSGILTVFSIVLYRKWSTSSA